MNVDTSVQVDLTGIRPVELLGEKDANLRRVEERYGITAVLRDGVLTLTGPSPRVERAGHLLEELTAQVARGRAVGLHDVDYFASLEQEEGAEAVADAGVGTELVFERRTVQLKSLGQEEYVLAIRNHDVVFGIGPAGTGKTYLAVAMAVQALKARQVERIVLCRPAVEAGENLGFLPGTFEDKIDPYLRPLYDSLRDLIAHDKVRRYLDLGVLEIAPLAYMRGRTLSRSFVVLDEAQNTTLKQMKMFLTRLGPYSKAVVTGDITQVDLDDPRQSGLIRIQGILEGAEGISFVRFRGRDVVRHRLVREILSAFDRHEEQEASARGGRPQGAESSPGDGDVGGDGDEGSRGDR